MKSEATLNMTLPVTMVLICLLSAGLLAHPVPFGYASLAMMVGGACLLALARWPLLRQRRFFEFGSGTLDKRHRMMYHMAYLAIWVGVILAFLVALPSWMSGKTGS